MQNARAIFLPKLSLVPNVHCGFRRDLRLDHLPHTATFSITARTWYRLYINGKLMAHGPARAGYGHCRVDEIEVTSALVIGENAFAVEVCGNGDAYGYSNDITCESSFLLAELVVDGIAIFGTDATWKGRRLPQRRTDVDRYSHCRQVTELYELDADFAAWRVEIGAAAPGDPVEIIAPDITLLPRGVPLPDLHVIRGATLVGHHGVKPDPKITVPLRFYEKPRAREIAKLAERPSTECAMEVPVPSQTTLSFHPTRIRTETGNVLVGHGATGVHSPEGGVTGTCLRYDFRRMHSGFIGISLELEHPGIVDLVHTERVDPDGSLNPRPTSNNALRLHCPAGSTDFLSFEAYGLRYLDIIIRSPGRFTLKDLYVRDWCFPDAPRGGFLCSDEDLNRIYDAAYRTTRLNTLDLFMDCPDRERGGWLCDSLWTGRAARMLLGDSTVERATLENFLHVRPEDKFHGFFPACYPGRKREGEGTITTWSFWLVLELDEYYKRTGDRALVDAFSEPMETLVRGADTFLNAHGLLEKLPIIFIDWSQSNRPENTTPISVAANALYARALTVAGKLYDRVDWRDRGEAMRRTLQAHASPDRRDLTAIPLLADALETGADGVLKAKPALSEGAQYTSLWSGLFTPEENPRLHDYLLSSFGPCPERSPHKADVGPANMFITLCVRLDLLARAGQWRRLVEELRAIYLPMLKDGPGTFWESRGGQDSRCHGFNGHAGVHLTRDVLGLGIPNELEKTIDIAPHPCGLQWATGTCETPSGLLSLSWHQSSTAFSMNLSAPKRFTVRFTIPDEVRGWADRTMNGTPVAAGSREITIPGGSISFKAVDG